MTARLTGRKLLLTRSIEDSDTWAEALAAEGALPIVFPCIETASCDSPGLARQIIEAAAEADWIVFTSRRGVDAFADLVPQASDITARIAVVGDATAGRAIEQLGRVDLAGAGTASQLATLLASAIAPGVKCLLALAANAGDTLERTLTEAGAAVTRCDVYRTIPKQPAAQRRPLSTLGCDAVIFASPTAVTGFRNQVDVDIENQFVTIGPSTSAAVRQHDWDVAAEAKEPSLTGIIESIVETEHV